MKKELRSGHIPNGGLRYQLREPRQNGVYPIVLLHGWSGDERSMWILNDILPPGGLVIAPRAPFQLQDDTGFSWTDPNSVGWSGFPDFTFSVGALVDLVVYLEDEYQVRRDQLVLMGFSQGAAFSLAVVRDGFRPAGVVVLSGFLPQGNVCCLEGLPVYWGHGRGDELVPIERARQDVDLLNRAGVRITYCEANVGHKIGHECAKNLGAWFEGELMTLDPAEGG